MQSSEELQPAAGTAKMGQQGLPWPGLLTNCLWPGVAPKSAGLKAQTNNAPATLVAFAAVTLERGGAAVFRNTHWTIRAGERWAVVGPNGSGKSLLAQVILGRIRPVAGEVQTGFQDAAGRELDAAEAVAWISPQTQRELMQRESSFYQSRWHSGLEEGEHTVASFLSQAAVEEINPYEVGAAKSSAWAFGQRRRELAARLGLGRLWRRKVLHLSNGEQRKLLLARCLLRAPQLLVLDDPYAGLDVATRRDVQGLIEELARSGQTMVFMTHRREEIPRAITHVMVVRDHRIMRHGPKARLWPSMPKRPLRQTNGPGARVRPRVLGQAVGAPLVELRRLRIVAGRQTLLRDLTWTIRAGEHWLVQGPNGAGKTTLLNVIQGDHPQGYAQSVRVLGWNLGEPGARWNIRREIGAVSPELHLHYPPEWTTLAVVCSGFFDSIGLHDQPSVRQRRAAREWLADFGLGDAAREPFGSLSVGQQRVALIGRAAVKQPRLLLLDEPCQGLDDFQRQLVLTLVDRLAEQSDASVVFVTHRAREIPRCLTHQLQLREGRVEFLGRMR